MCQFACVCVCVYVTHMLNMLKKNKRGGEEEVVGEMDYWGVVVCGGV